MSSIDGFGMYVPDRIVSNGEIGGCLDCSPEWISDVSGIDERRYARADETVADMAVAAGRDCLTSTEIDPSEVGMVIVASGTADRRFPGPAATVAANLGVVGPAAIDIPVASAGSLIALALAADLAPRIGKVLVIAAERLSTVAFGDPVEKGTAVLFGDGAGACLVGPSQGPIRLLDSVLHSDGTFAADLRLEFSGGVLMNGRSVIMQAMRKIPAAIEEVLTRNGLAASDAAAFIMHQANQNLIDRVARTLGVESELFFSNIRKYGNTSSASMLIAAAEWWKSNTARAGSHVCFAAFGAGFHWGAMLAQISDASAESSA